MDDSTPGAGKSRTTAVDVARKAGVSRTTVSFVMNGKSELYGIPSKTAQRVREAAEGLGYIPDRAGRALQSGRSDIVVFAAPSRASLSPLALSILGDVTDELATSGLHMVIRRVAPGGAFREIWRNFNPAVVVGLEVAEEDMREAQMAGVAGFSFDVGSFDDSIGNMQADHLLSCGHRSLAYVAPDDPALAVYARRRLAGVRRVCAERGAPPPVVVTTGLNGEDAARAVGELSKVAHLTGVCAFNDDYAFAILAGMAKRGLRAPQDLAIVGADNGPLCSVAVPELTTIDPGAGEISALLVDQILALIAGEAPRRTPAIGARVLKRQSS